MLLLILSAGVTDIILFLLSMGMCFGKCKDSKRTWFSYSCVRGATKCASEMVNQICQFTASCGCCICFPITLPIGFSFVFIGFGFDIIAWMTTGFYCFGYCCFKESFLEYSLGIKAWRNLKRCALRVRNCD